MPEKLYALSSNSNDIDLKIVYNGKFISPLINNIFNHLILLLYT